MLALRIIACLEQFASMHESPIPLHVVPVSCGAPVAQWIERMPPKR